MTSAEPDDPLPVVLHEITAPLVGETRAAGTPQPPRWVGPLYLGMAVLLIPWVLLLAFRLPAARSGTPHYRLAWVGFDLVLVLALARTAYLAIRDSPFIVNIASATAALLLVDAWFDVTTSQAGAERAEAIAAAVLLEIPIALLSLWIAGRSQERIARTPAGRRGTVRWRSSPAEPRRPGPR